ncbi:FtsB family cell division protein [Stakelama tenebrarum]|uniref:Septum formation initiator family protein n=1 Tax=Stakelama tenebrarum TaxID=2711215 RepID=A0A6G6Y6B6_9SPHN|nr:septum formation initiator family protein [Sphingosinithalassobacter tenebrarum]QIG80465.1 septum formation initiator family protein [Sphingosinithalassobacter tenebrarum]
MSRKSTVSSILRSAGMPAVALISMAFFGYYAVLGPNGAMAHPEVKQQLEARQAEYQRLDKQRADLKNRVDLLDPEGADPDLVEELARKKLNVARPDEVIVPLK